MNETNNPSLTPREVVRLLVEKRLLWIGPAVVCGALAAAYALVAPRYWEASQALVVRQETAGAPTPRPGKFADLYEMKTLQETILELAKSRHVVAETLRTVDAELAGGPASEPTDKQIEQFRKRMKMLPPGGAEFGKTEVFYFQVKDRSRERAIKLVEQLCDQLDAGLRRLRIERAESLIGELKQEVALAAKTNSQETRRLREFESKVGADLGELRMMQTGSSGQSDLRQEAVTLANDVRRYQLQVHESEKLLELLRLAERDPQELIATPNSLLVAQPALKRLKDGLVDAQIRTARLEGTRSEDHPRVQVAVDAQAQIRADLTRELAAAIRGAEVDLDLGRQRYNSAHERMKSVEARLGHLAELRAEYSNRVAAVDNSRQSLDKSRQSLATAQAAEAAAHSGSLVSRIDRAETGPYPAGPGRTVIASAGMLGGLVLGLGLVFLTAGSPTTALTLPVSDWWKTAQREREPSPAAYVAANLPAEEPVEPAAGPFDSVEPYASAPADPPITAAEVWRYEQPDNAPAVEERSDPRDEWWNEPAIREGSASAAELWSTPAPSVQPSEQSPAEVSAHTWGEPYQGNDDQAEDARLAELVLAAEAGSSRALFEVLPTVAGTLPSFASAGEFSGLSLEEALATVRSSTLTR